MPRYRANVAISIKGDRIERGAEFDASADDVAHIDPEDITEVGATPATEAEAQAVDVPVSEMSVAELRAKAKELGLTTTGTKADLQERISLHQAGNDQSADGQDGTITSE